MIDDALRERVQQALGQRVVGALRLAGGDINDAFELRLAAGERVFLKTNRAAPRGLFVAEARGLSFLAEARALRTPEVLAVSAPEEQPGFLLLEFLASGTPRRGFDQQLGRGLAALHRAGAPELGLDHDNFIGRLPQSNRRHATWAAFYRAERLEPQVRLAVDSGRAPSTWVSAFERLFAVLAERVGPVEPVARLHGDLWGGNLHVDADGAPTLIDPAAYGGHREMDLAMMRLFGGFAPAVFSAYQESFPLAPGHAERVPLYQLYPLLVHVNLFGGGYVAQVSEVLTRLTR